MENQSLEGSKKKYDKIFSYPSIDGLISAGLVSRLYDISRIFLRLKIKSTRNSIVLGMPVTEDINVTESFIIDNYKCEKLWSVSQASNFFLCDKNYGSLTDLLVSAFDFIVPDDILDSIFDAATVNFEEDSFAEKLSLLNFVLSFKERFQIINLVRENLWDDFQAFVNNRLAQKDTKYVLQKGKLLASRAKPFIRDFLYVYEDGRSKLDKLAARFAAVFLATKYPLALALMRENNNVFSVHIFSGVYDLIPLGENLRRLGFNIISRPNHVRFKTLGNPNIILEQIRLLVRRIPRR